MINKISYNQPVFTGKSYKSAKQFEEFADEAFNAIKKSQKDYKSENLVLAHRAYANISEPVTNVKLEKKVFGFGTKDSIAIEPYTGSTEQHIGFSTEDGGGYGGGYIKAHINTPLSTANIHTCAAVNLVDESSGQQFLYHVYKGARSHGDETPPSAIEKFLRENFPRFSKVNIIPGDQYQTNKTVNNILQAINNINNKAKQDFYHFTVKNPEIVAHKGKITYIERQNNEMTFKEIQDNFA